MSSTTKRKTPLCKGVVARLAVRLFPRHLNVWLLGSASAATVRACLAYALQLRSTRMFLETRLSYLRTQTACIGRQTLIVFAPDRAELQRCGAIGVDMNFTEVCGEGSHEGFLCLILRLNV